MIGRRYRQIKGREEVKVFSHLYYYALLDAIITSGILLGVLFFDIPPIIPCYHIFSDHITGERDTAV